MAVHRHRAPGSGRARLLVLLSAGSAVAFPLGAQAQSYLIKSITEATYADIPSVRTDCVTTAGTFCTSEARTGPGPLDGEAYAWGGYQEVAFGGELRGISYAWGWAGPFGPPSEVIAETQVSVGVVFDSRSTTLPPSTPMRVRSFIPVHGVLGLSAHERGAIRVSESLSVWDHTGPFNTLYHGIAEIGASAQFLGDWAGDATPTTVGIPGISIPIMGFEIDTLDIVAYDTFLGNRFAISFLLNVETSVSGPFEQFAIADFSNTSSFTLDAVDPVTGDPLDVTFEPIRCFADCDWSTGLLTLDVFDFLCFQDRFVSADTYACDCDTSTGAGVCDVFDFLCFQDAFVAGCP